ncbi:MAG: hypothetical protein ABIS50_24800 [Luteolibacter sp.]|uniref:hypothetical protein n=1 Tax=Luteolibacter sp. TaxID=1962973 RepID=UPI003265CD4E
MKRSLILLLVLFAAACREEKKPQISSAMPTRQLRPASQQPRSAASLGLPPNLLVTPRVTISFSGMAVGFGIVDNASQAEAILTDIRTLPPSAGRDRAMASVISSLAKVDPAQACILLEKWNDGLISQWLDVAETIAKKLGESDPQAAAEFIEKSVPRAAQASVWNHFLASLPATARLSLFDQIPESSSQNRIGASLVLVWLREDPGSCAAWLDRFAAGKFPDELQDLGNPSFYPQPMKTEPAAWLAAFRAAKGAEARILFAEGAWKNTDASAKAGLIPELQDVIPKLIEEEREKIILADPPGYTAALSPTQITELSHDTMQKIIGSWAEAHPQDAIQWALDHGRPEAAGALNPLYRLEPESALALAPRLLGGKDRDQAISSLCYSLTRDQGADAAKALLPLISDPQFRERMRKEIDRDWD